MQRAVSFPAVQFHLSVEGNGSTVRERKDEKKKKNIPRFYVIILSFFFFSRVSFLRNDLLKKKKREKEKNGFYDGLPRSPPGVDQVRSLWIE